MNISFARIASTVLTIRVTIWTCNVTVFYKFDINIRLRLTTVLYELFTRIVLKVRYLGT